MLEIGYTALLAVSAFWLGTCPFSVWVGWWLLGKDIREYGDGNPGAANVFRAGGRKSGCLAVVLDIAKGVPFVVLAYSFFRFAEPVIMAVALSAILGHALSPLLRFKGGKAIAVTYGVLLALSPYDMLIPFAAFMFLGFLVIEGEGDICVVNVDGSNQINLTNNSPQETGPAWSPDGSRIAFNWNQG